MEQVSVMGGSMILGWWHLGATGHKPHSGVSCRVGIAGFREIVDITSKACTEKPMITISSYFQTEFSDGRRYPNHFAPLVSCVK